MKEITLTNAALMNIVNVFFDPSGFKFNKNIKTKIAVRQSLKSILKSVGDAWNIALDTWNEIVLEAQEDFLEDDKAYKENDEFKLKTEYEDEFNLFIQEKNKEFSNVTTSIEFQPIPEKEYMSYIELNDGLFSDIELDVLELFIEAE